MGTSGQPLARRFKSSAMAPAQQTKKVKKSADNINAKLALVIKSGKYSLGYKSVLKAMRSKTPVHLYQGSNVALGTAAGKLFRVGVMSIESAGDSDLLSITA